MSSTSASTPLTTLQLVRMTGPIILSGILLPIVDNLTDLRMIIRLYSGIPSCNYVHPSDYYYNVLNGTWEDVITCQYQQDPDTFCQVYKESSHCVFFFGNGYPSAIYPGCTWDIVTCRADPATFCEYKPDRVTCGGIYTHRIFASMFLGNFLLFTRNNLMKSFLFQCRMC